MRWCYRRNGDPGSWMDDPELVAQLAHFAWGYGVVLSLCLLARWRPAVALAALTLLWAAPKEFAIDIVFEGDSWASSALDFAVYLLGGLVGWAAWHWR